MKKILLMVTLLISSTVLAQGLFPELAGFGGRERKSTQKPTETVAPASDSSEDHMPDIKASTSTEDETLKTDEELATKTNESEASTQPEPDLFAPNEKAETTEQAPLPSENIEEKTEEDNNQKIIIYLASADSTTPPNENFAYCFGDLKFASTFKRPVQALTVTLTYGPYSSTYTIKNLVRNVEQSNSFGLVGDACNSILDMPKMEITQCVIEGMDEAACKKKVTFLPLNETEE